MNEAEYITVPLVKQFDHASTPIGTIKIRRDALPDKPDWVISMAYVQQDGGGYELMDMSIISDSEYREYTQIAARGQA